MVHVENPCRGEGDEKQSCIIHPIPVLTLYGSSQQTSQPPPHAGSEEHTDWKLAGRWSGGGEKMLMVELTAACRIMMVFGLQAL